MWRHRILLPTFFLLYAAVPTAIHAQLWQKTSGPHLAHVYSLAVNETGVLFAGTWKDGMFRSSTNGNTWSQINNGLTSMTVRSIAIRKNGHIYIGTHDNVFRSVNNGESWDQLLVNLSHPQVYSIIVDSLGVLYAGTCGQGVFTSTDEGITWTQINTGLGNLYVNTLSLTFGFLYAGTWGGLYRSSDNGATWIAIGNGLPTISINAVRGTAAHKLFCATWDGIYRSLDSGAAWTKIVNGLSAPIVTSIAVNDKNHLFIGTDGGGVYTSTNDGNEWKEANSGLTNFTVDELVMNGSQILFAGSGGDGVFRTAYAVPVELSAFSAGAFDGVVEIQWETMLEQNLSHFEVQRRIMGSDDPWTTIIVEQPKPGLRVPKYYSVRDLPHMRNELLYRLRIVDADGATQYSDEVFVDMQTRADNIILAETYPNPTRERATFRYSIQRPAFIMIKLYDIKGRFVAVLLEETKPAGTYERVYYTDGLAPGQYLCEFSTPWTRKVVRFSIVH